MELEGVKGRGKEWEEHASNNWKSTASQSEYAFAQAIDCASPTQQKIGHFGDVSPSQSLGLVWKKLNLTQQQHAFANQK